MGWYLGKVEGGWSVACGGVLVSCMMHLTVRNVVRVTVVHSIYNFPLFYFVSSLQTSLRSKHSNSMTNLVTTIEVHG